MDSRIVFSNHSSLNVSRLRQILIEKKRTPDGTKNALLARITLHEMELPEALPEFDQMVLKGEISWTITRSALQSEVRGYGLVPGNFKYLLVPQVLGHVFKAVIRRHRSETSPIDQDISQLETMIQLREWSTERLDHAQNNLRQQARDPDMVERAKIGLQLVITFITGLKAERAQVTNDQPTQSGNGRSTRSASADIRHPPTTSPTARRGHSQRTSLASIEAEIHGLMQPTASPARVAANPVADAGAIEPSSPINARYPSLPDNGVRVPGPLHPQRDRPDHHSVTIPAIDDILQPNPSGLRRPSSLPTQSPRRTGMPGGWSPPSNTAQSPMQFRRENVPADPVPSGVGHGQAQTSNTSPRPQSFLATDRIREPGGLGSQARFSIRANDPALRRDFSHNLSFAPSPADGGRVVPPVRQSAAQRINDRVLPYTTFTTVSSDNQDETQSEPSPSAIRAAVLANRQHEHGTKQSVSTSSSTVRDNGRDAQRFNIPAASPRTDTSSAGGHQTQAIQEVVNTAEAAISPEYDEFAENISHIRQAPASDEFEDLDVYELSDLQTQFIHYFHSNNDATSNALLQYIHAFHHFSLSSQGRRFNNAIHKTLERNRLAGIIAAVALNVPVQSAWPGDLFDPDWNVDPTRALEDFRRRERQLNDLVTLLTVEEDFENYDATTTR